MPILDLCSQSPVCIEKTAQLSEAARMMKKYHVGGIIVTESKSSLKPVGIITDRDIALSFTEKIPPDTKVESLMSKNPITAPAEKGIASIIDIMESEGIRRIIVVDKTGKACGLVSSDDIIQLLAREMSGLGKLVNNQIQNEKINSSHSEVLMT